MTTGRLGVEVTRETEEVVDELMQYRNKKVEGDADFPANYKARVYGTGNPSEDAFYNAHADSNIRMSIEPRTGFDTLHDVALAVNETINSEVSLGAKVEDIYEHGPVLQQGIEALEEVGFEPYAELEGEYQRDNIAETLDMLEEEGVNVRLWANESQVNDHSDAHYISADYNPEKQKLSPNVQVCVPSHAEEGQSDELERRMEEALDELDLLE